MKFSLVNTALSHALGASLAGLILVVGFTFLFHEQEPAPVASAPPVWPEAITLNESVLQAKAAVVYDPATGRILYEKNAHESLPLASLTKLMAAQVVLASSTGDTAVTITRDNIATEGDWGFWVGETWPLYDLLRFGLAASSNDAIAAAAAAGNRDTTYAMNQSAKALGLEETYFLNPTGLDEDLEVAGGYGSARDVALLAAVFLKDHPSFLQSTAAPVISIHNGLRTLSATSTAIPLQNMHGLVGAKTGFTDLAGGNLVAVVDIEIGRPLIVAVLGSTIDGRFKDVETLINAFR